MLSAIVDRKVDSRTMVMIVTGVMIPPEHCIASHWVSDNECIGIRVQPRSFSRVPIVIAVVIDDEHFLSGEVSMKERRAILIQSHPSVSINMSAYGTV